MGLEAQRAAGLAPEAGEVLVRSPESQEAAGGKAKHPSQQAGALCTRPVPHRAARPHILF